MAKNTICLWYDHDAEDAARFYAATFPNSSVGAVLRAPGDYPDGKTGDVYFPKELQGTSMGFGEIANKDDSVEFKKNSRLFIINGYISEGNEQVSKKYGIWYFEWTGKSLKLTKFVAKKEHID